MIVLTYLGRAFSAWLAVGRQTDLEFSREHSACVDVAGVGLDGLVVPQDLGCGGCGHGGQQ